MSINKYLLQMILANTILFGAYLYFDWLEFSWLNIPNAVVRSTWPLLMSFSLGLQNSTSEKLFFNFPLALFAIAFTVNVYLSRKMSRK
jgi:hypothetical protein